MKLRITSILLIALFVIAGQCNLFAQDEAASQKAMMDYMAPGQMHQMLAKNVGEWKTKIKLWMQPGGEPVVSEGTSTSEMILGGRYLQTKHSASFMNMPMQGLGLDAYDNGKKTFISVWFDNMGTGVMVLEGKYDEAAKTITYFGKVYEPVSAKEINVKEIVRFVNDNLEIMEMYMLTGNSEFKSMEIEMKRVK